MTVSLIPIIIQGEEYTLRILHDVIVSIPVTSLVLVATIQFYTTFNLGPSP